MEEKVDETLKIIDDDGDSFAQRAEMYYKKRPELINFVKESFRAYQALAEKYDYLSRDLQSANCTIATVFPERVQFAMDDEDEENFPQASTSSHDPSKPSKDSEAFPKPIIPRVPKIPKKELRSPSMSMTKWGPFRRTSSSAKADTTLSLGLSKTEALEEIDKLQKGILALQTEKEFVKSSYENNYAKYWDIENQITQMQGRVCGLQDEFGIGTVIEDNDARTLMAATALKSCQESLFKLQETQEQSVAEAEAENQRIREAHEKLEMLKDEFLYKQTDWHEPPEEKKSVSASPDTEQEKHDLETLREKFKENLNVNSSTSLTVTELAEKIDELVDKVVTLGTLVSSQNSLVKRLRTETDELQVHIQSLEVDKETLIKDSGNMSNKLRELEEFLCRVNNLNRSFKDQNNHLQKHFTEATCNVDHLTEKLKTVKLDEEIENTGLFHGHTSAISKDTITEAAKKADVPIQSNSVKGEEENQPAPRPQEPTQLEKDEKQNFSETVHNNLDKEAQEVSMKEEEEDETHWRQLFLNGLEDREKIILEEYTAVLQNYKEVKKKLGEMEKKNRDGLFELAMQMRELKSALVFKDEEIQSLHQKLGTGQANPGENRDTDIRRERPYGSNTQVASSRDSDVSSLTSYHREVTNLLSEHNGETTERLKELTVPGNLKNYPTKREENEMKVKHVDEHHAVSNIEEKFRIDIDKLLEKNLEFWLRFSTSFHQIQKFQTSSQDLQAELSKLKDNIKKQEGNTKHQSPQSDARPIYKHLREIQTELKLWLEHNSVLKDELQGRFSSLCDIQEEISRVSNSGSKQEETQLSDYQAAKFQGEVQNMKQENIKIAVELQAGLDCVKRLQVEIDKTLAKLDEDLGISASKNHQSYMNRTQIPLRSFLFGVKLKKQKPSIFSCMNPALRKQYSDHLAAGIPPR